MHPGIGLTVSLSLIGRERNQPISISLKSNIGPWIRAVQDIKGSRVIHKNFGKFGEKVWLWVTLMTHIWLIFLRMKSTLSYLENKNVFSLGVLEKITTKKLSKMKSAEPWNDRPSSVTVSVLQPLKLSRLSNEGTFCSNIHPYKGGFSFWSIFHATPWK